MSRFVHGVEGMKKFLLGLLFTGDKLHVIHQKQIGLAIFFPHLRRFSGADRLHQFVGQIVALYVGDFGIRLPSADHMGNGVEQVSLAQTRIPVDKQRIVVLGRLFRHGDGGGIGHFVGRSNHEGLKGEVAGGKQIHGALSGLPAVKGGKLLIGQNHYLKVLGEDIVEGGFDVL
ncbi:hypothetical protein SDC9_184355 [bioreactor metagenome]|uniref:Uncharacterized protein n=1 Tax=bioreactor metagenome TaxID=1076179 RepID=A0A645HN21_9ZZZZ